METITRDQIRAARMLLNISQDELSKAAGVGVATVRRFELGQNIRGAQLQAILRALLDAGVLVIEDGAMVDGVEVSIGVALAKSARGLPAGEAKAKLKTE